MRNVFSFVADPNADTVVVAPLAGEVGEMPGADLMKSTMLARRVGIASRSSSAKRVLKPGSRLSMRAAEASTTVVSTTLATSRRTMCSIVSPAPIVRPSAR